MAEIGIRRWPLARQLALLISALLATVVVLFGLAAWDEMRDTSVESATERLRRLAQQLAANSAGGGGRQTTLRTLAATPAVREAVRGGGLSAAARARLLSGLSGSVPRNDSTVEGWELWSGEDRRITTAAAAGARDAEALAYARTQAVHDTTVARSPLFVRDGRAYYWFVAPVMENGRAIGALAELRRTNTSERQAAVVRELVGGEVDVHLASREMGDWVAIGGRPAPALFALPDSAGPTSRIVDVAGDARFAAVAQIGSTPWLVVLSQPETAVLRRPREFLNRLLIIGGVLLALGTFAAWLIGRHATRPLRQLTHAAEGLAEGDYARRVDVAGGAEVARLASTFNSMAARIGQAHAELAERNQALQVANESKSRFLAMMSHELRTPLNAIGGYTEILELGLHGPVTEAQVEDLKRIRRSRDHLLSIITDILGFARADAGQLQVTMTCVRLQDVFLETEAALRVHLAEKQGVELEIERVPGILVLADREKLQQVVFNLMTNAIRFTDAGGLVRLFATAEGDVVTIHVEDAGIGIAPDKLSSIFEPFVQVDATLTRRVGGTGLGLAIARELTEAMQGTIAVRSELGQGSRFSVTLRRGDVTAAQPSSASAERSSAST